MAAEPLRPGGELVEEAGRQLTICNACRYCEGYCAVFPAAERRTFFGEGDVTLLANLCHDCGACYQACMFAPPHEFAVDIRTLLGQARLASYRRYAWPGALRGLLARPGWTAAGLAAAGLVLVLVAMALHGGLAALPRVHTGPGAFYRLIAYEVLVAGGLVLAAAALAVLGGGFWRLWRETGGTLGQLASARLWAGALWDVALLRYLSAAGEGCRHPDPDRPSQARRVLHQLVLAGLLLCFAATVVAAVFQDILGWLPPYPLVSAPVLLGTVGGFALLIGASGLLWLRSRVPAGGAPGAGGTALDVAFLVLLEVVGGTGLILLALRTTPAMGALLALHLGAVAGLFATAPYGKLVHAPQRLAALLRDRAEAAG
jgi:citrate/tricarballylate utilization protein